LEYLLAGDDVTRGRDTRPWDVQFELFTAAWLILGGTEVTPGEPDLRLLYGRARVGIAAKRVSSLQPKQLKERVKSAVGQIQETKQPGFIALNLDSRFANLDPVQARACLIPEFDRRFDELHEHARYYAREPLVIGVMSFGYTAAWSAIPAPTGVPQLYRTAPFRWLAFDDAPGGKALFDAFAQGWEGRISARFERMLAGEFDE
jgi:hypothetical protein